MKIKAECDLGDPLLGFSQEEADRLLGKFGAKDEICISTDPNKSCAEVADDDPESRIEIPNFPTNVFPIGLKELALDLSRSMGVPTSATGTMVLTILSAAIGNSIRISPKATFEIPPFLWTGVVMPTGSGKSPLLELLIKPVKWRQARSYTRYKSEAKQYELALRAFKKNEGDELPSEPTIEQYSVQDSTIEALGSAFESQPRGLLGLQDELGGWLCGMNQYKGGKGNDRQLYLQLFNGNSWSINRKSGIKFIPQTGLSIVGNLPPEMVPLLFGDGSFSDGLIQRFIFVCPDVEPMKFCRESVTGLTLWDDLVDWCYQIPVMKNELGFTVPRVLRLQGQSLDIYEAFYNEYGKTASVLPTRYRGFISKLYLYCLKFAGILHVIRGYGSGNIPDNIDERTITDAAALTKFYFGQIRLILGLYERSKEAILSEPQKRVIQILYDLQSEVEGGKLRLGKIVDCYNDGLPTNFQLTSEKVASILKNGLGLTTQKGAGNHSFLLWEGEKLKKYFKRTVTTVTSVKRKVEKQDATVTEVTVDSKENFKSSEIGPGLTGLGHPRNQKPVEPCGKVGVITLDSGFELEDV